MPMFDILIVRHHVFNEIHENSEATAGCLRLRHLF